MIQESVCAKKRKQSNKKENLQTWVLSADFYMEMAGILRKPLAISCEY